MELVERIDRQELHAGGLVDLVAAHAGEDRLHHARRPRIAIVVRVFKQRAALAEERVVDAPGIDADALERAAGDRVEPTTDVAPQPLDVPAGRPGLVNRLVRKPPDVREGEHTGPKPAEYRAAALRAEIDREILTGHFIDGVIPAPPPEC
jgi:hypothetical protein